MLHSLGNIARDSMEKAYEPKRYEDDIYRQWEESGAFQPAAQGDPFVIPIPPPNVTGTLHAGHAMFVTLEDIMTRYNRMRGKAALWVPGTDHAAIATETVVLKNLGIKERNKEIGREAFIEEAKKWTGTTHERIITQMKKMGASCDWSREAYTFDETRNLGVNTVFKMLYEKGLIYRGDRMVNWSVGAESVLSDDEVVWEDRVDEFYSIRCGEFVIGTVRSETKGWDSPLFVNPHGEYVRVRFDYADGSGETVIIAKNLFDDEPRRKKTLNLMEPEGSRLTVLETIKGSHFVGEEFVAETYAGQRKFVVMADEEIVDMEKGTGAMTISILHSADDYELARKHNIEGYRFLKLGFDGRMTAAAGPLAGMKIAAARKEAAKIMREKGLLVGEDTHYEHRVPLCYRSNTVVEPMVSRQWFVAVEKEFIDDFTEETTTLKKMTQNAVKKSYKLKIHLYAELNKYFLIDINNPIEVFEWSNFPIEQDQEYFEVKSTSDDETIIVPKEEYLAAFNYENSFVKKFYDYYLNRNYNEAIENSEVKRIFEDSRRYNDERDGRLFEKLLAASDSKQERIAIQMIFNEKNRRSDLQVKFLNPFGGKRYYESEAKKGSNYIGKDIVVPFSRNKLEIVSSKKFKRLEIFCNEQLKELVYIPEHLWGLTEDQLKKRLLSEEYKVFYDGDIEIGNAPVKVIPERFEKTYFHWIDNLRDWCISRQIWWGHRIPVWYDAADNIHLPREQQVIFCRHAEDTGNRDDLMGYDFPLTEKGRTQAEETAKNLWSKNITRILTSPARGAKETAEIIGKQLGIEVEDFPEFGGPDLGIVTGLPGSITGGKQSFAYAIEKNTGESAESLYNRVKQGWERLKAIREEGAILVISHRTVYSALDAVRAGKPAAQILANRHLKEHLPHGLVSELTLLQPPDGDNLRQDEDTLDTWFSSALWPFSIFGWPEKTPDLERFYPTDILETGYDILFFWVARMIMFGKFATGKYPFHTVYLHGLVCDAKGQKMSKSKGNGIDPLTMIEQFGTDALRLSLIMGTTPGNNVNLGEEKIAGCRNFCNKLWNISRFVLSQEQSKNIDDLLQIALTHENLTDLQKWLLNRVKMLEYKVTEELENFRFGNAAQLLWDFTWNEFADWAVEASKAENSDITNTILKDVLERILVLWHPFIPFVTEKIWEEINKINNKNNMLIEERWKEINIGIETFLQIDVEAYNNNFGLVKEVISKIRSMRKNAGVDPTRKISTYIIGQELETLKRNAAIIKSLARIESLTFETDMTKRPLEDGATDMVSGVTIFLPSAGMIDPAAEKARVAKELENAKAQLSGTQAKLDNPQFLEKAPEHVVNQLRAKAEELKAKIGTLETKK